MAHSKLFGKYPGILAVIAGILVIVFPDFLRWIVGAFLIIYGLLELK